MSEEEIKRIENTINENKDYREHFHLHDYFEVEYIDKLVTSYKQLQQENKQLKEVIDKLKINIENDIDGFRTINEFGESQAILELLDIYLGILKEVNK